MSMTPTSLYEWLATASIPVAGFAVRYSLKAANRFELLDVLFKRKEAEDKVRDARADEAQRATDIKIAEHRLMIQQVQGDLSSINQKLEPLPRIATLLEALHPAIARIVPREELEIRFRNLEQSLCDEKPK
jgi:hypothetical protein